MKIINKNKVRFLISLFVLRILARFIVNLQPELCQRLRKTILNPLSIYLLLSHSDLDNYYFFPPTFTP
ncbi:MAG: hypothetical protein B6D55_03810 [Candidatus Omnitrophica bacterium 4484_70.2]|nr:MAG: hypothetical protein B6D55_03810 [Candidatus Omnitrophica bacterium 4484_70.2]